jgi:accessory colonization factor AcfC
MLNPWIFGLQSVHQAWQAQSAMAVSLVRLFGGGGPDQNTSTVDITQEDKAATAANVQKAPAANELRKAPKSSPVSKRASRVKPRIVSKRAAAASQNRASKVIRRSRHKPR